MEPETTVGVRELRQNLSRYLDEVKAGRSYVVTERGREVARLTPSGGPENGLARLISERGATIPRGGLLDAVASGQKAPATSGEILDDLRQERL